MTGSYVLEIPDLHRVLKQEDVAHWEVFLTHTGKKDEKINWPFSAAGNSFVFHNSMWLEKQIKSVKIDFTDNQVTFYKNHTDPEGFEEFLDLVFSKMVIRINPNQMHFLVSPKSFPQRSTSRRM